MSLASCVVQIHTPTISALAVVRKIIPSSKVAWFRRRFQWMKRSSVLDTGSEMTGSIPVRRNWNENTVIHAGRDRIGGRTIRI